MKFAQVGFYCVNTSYPMDNMLNRSAQTGPPNVRKRRPVFSKSVKQDKSAKASSSRPASSSSTTDQAYCPLYRFKNLRP